MASSMHTSIGGATKQVILDGEAVNLLRPAVIDIIRRLSYEVNRDVYGMMRIADAFDVKPRDVGFDFATWGEYWEAENKVRIPNFEGINVPPSGMSKY